MISIVNWILNLIWRSRFGPVIFIRRTLGTKGFRIHLLGLSVAAMIAWMVILIQGISTMALTFVAVTTAIVFLASLYGALWLPLVALAILGYFAGFLPAIHPYAEIVVGNYLAGYVAGVLLGLFYNDLIYLHARIFRRNSSRIVFATRRDRSLNFIKSPLIHEITHTIPQADQHKYFVNDLAQSGKMKMKPDTWLYDFEPDHNPPHPFTIAIVANPIFRERVGDSFQEAIDPIIEDRDLFLRSAERVLQSLSSNAVVGAPEIWSKIRIVTVSHKQVAGESWEDIGMAQSFEAGLHEISGYAGDTAPTIDGATVEDLIDPAADARDRYLYMLKAAEGDFPPPANAGSDALDPDQLCRETDMLIILSAVPKYIRATAQFGNWYEDVNDRPASPDMKGEEFELDIANLPAKCEDPVHAFYFHNPGRMAVNVLEAGFRTYIHEFGHAISDVDNGVVVDEYYDRFSVAGVPDRPGQNERWFAVNRDERRTDRASGRILQPIRREFSEYRLKLKEQKEPKTRFVSDTDHPSSQENWLGFFPGRDDVNANCIMDRTGARNRFDALLSKFIYDRLWVKANRMQSAPAAKTASAAGKKSKSSKKGVDKDATV